MNASELTFKELDKRINEMPDGPSKVLDTPRPLLLLSIVGTIGVVMGLLPSLLIRLMTPQWWMVTLGQMGVLISVIGYAPSILRSLFLMLRGFLYWRPELVEQLDHDFLQFRALSKWIHGFGHSVIEERLRFVEHVQERLAVKLAFLSGSAEKLGVLPLIVAVTIQVKAFSGSVSIWEVFLGLFAAMVYLITMTASLMRIRLQLYQLVLAEAIATRRE